MGEKRERKHGCRAVKGAALLLGVEIAHADLVARACHLTCHLRAGDFRNGIFPPPIVSDSIGGVPDGGHVGDRKKERGVQRAGREEEHRVCAFAQRLGPCGSTTIITTMKLGAPQMQPQKCLRF
eukprot:SAG11_NODE_192_length_12931_cov_5.747682_5_plen_124_part_00